jgi:hypothetical protein
MGTIEEDEDFKITSGKQLREAYGDLLDEYPGVALDPGRVPAGLRHLMALAELFGQEDDLVREHLLAKASPQLREELQRQVAASEQDLNAWLAGPEADNPEPSDEYIAFSAMRMAADYLNG